jgi:hypothetical protein
VFPELRGTDNSQRRHDTQHNDIQQNDTQQNDTQQNDTRQNDTQYNNMNISGALSIDNSQHNDAA